jgi:nicotinamidase-related amidase
MEELKRIGKRFVIVSGIEAHICVLQTVTGLLEAGYQPVVVEDCISSRKANDKAVAVERMRKEGALITTYESLLYELCRFAGTKEFKEILKLIK